MIFDVILNIILLFEDQFDFLLIIKYTFVKLTVETELKLPFN